MRNRISLPARAIFAVVLAAAMIGAAATAFADEGHGWGHDQDRGDWHEHHERGNYYSQPGYYYYPPPPPVVYAPPQPVYAPPVAPSIGLFFNIR